MKQSRVNTKSTSCAALGKIAEKSGFVIKQGNKHCKVETSEGMFVTIIPRHNPLKRETAKAIIEALNRFGAKIEFT